MNLWWLRRLKIAFSLTQAQKKTLHYMVRSNLLHLCILVGPSGWSEPFEFSWYLCIKSWNLRMPSVEENRKALASMEEQVRLIISEASLLDCFKEWGWLENQKIDQKMMKISIFWKMFGNLKKWICGGSGASKLHFLCRRRKRKHSITWCEALSSIFVSWWALRADLDPLNFRMTSASNLEILGWLVLKKTRKL